MRPAVRARGTPYWRLVCACVIVAAIFVLVGASRAVGELTGSAAEYIAAATSPTVGYEAVMQDARDTYEQVADTSDGVLSEELVSISGRSGARFDESAQVAGWLCEGSVADVLTQVQEEFERKGWASCENNQEESNQEGCLSFSKSQGTYRWAFVTGTQVGSSVSVVVRYA